MKEETDINLDKSIENYYGFIYITTNKINGRKYIGQRKYYGNWQSYLGSGTILKNAFKKYGIEKFSKEIIENCSSKEELNKREKYWIDYYNVIEDKLFYNIAKGGNGGDTYSGLSEEEIHEIMQKMNRK